ncbi:MAG: PQQ-binding-like beta-propeller repeat protein, partial [Halobacteriales archaeon]|nr:PQQ-binding-like beta-propeller repeat protein [Halobacteriales archaeon]
MSSERGQSEVLSTIAITAVVIVLSITIGQGILAGIDTGTTPLFSADLSMNDGNITIVHAGGDRINASDLRVIFHTDGNRTEFNLGNETIDGDGDGAFEPDESVTHPHGFNTSVIDVLIVHRPTNSVVLDEAVEPTDTTITFGGGNQAPTASFSHSPSPMIAGESGNFNASAATDPDGLITGYEWDFTSDGTFDATGMDVNHTFPSSGNYTVTLRVTDDNGLTATTTNNITVNSSNELPTPAFTYSPSNPVTDESISFDASGSSDPDGSITTYEWDWTSDGTYDSTGKTATHQYETGGNHTVTLRVVDDDNDANTTTKTVTVFVPEWPMKAADAQNTGNASLDAPRSKALTAWTYDAPGDGFDSAGPVVYDETVYIGSKDQTLYAIHAANGTKRWSYISPDDEIKSTPAVTADTVYVGSKDGTLHAVYTANGTKRWTYSTNGDLDKTSPTVEDGVVYIGDKKGKLYAIYANNGSRKWKENVGKEIKTTPAINGSTVYVADKKDETLYALSTADGTEEWSYALGDDPELTGPTVVDGTVYLGDKSGTIYAIDADSGTKEWSTDVAEEIKSQVSIRDSTVYVPAKKQGKVYALATSDGSQQWVFDTDGELEDAAPAVANGTVYVGDKDGTVYGIDADTGTELWKIDVASEIKSPVAVANNSVYTADAKNGEVYAIKHVVYEFTESWTQFQNDSVNSGNSTNTGPTASLQERWRFSAGGEFNGAGAAVIEDRVYVGNKNGNLYGLYARNGSTDWTYSAGSEIRS